MDDYWRPKGYTYNWFSNYGIKLLAYIAKCTMDRFYDYQGHCEGVLFGKFQNVISER